MTKRAAPVSFWVTNITKMNISLADLNVTIPPYSSVNLLKPKKYYLTLEQLKKSAQSGSLFKKRDRIVVRQQAPETESSVRVVEESTFTAIRETQERSLIMTSEEYIRELDVRTDEEIRAAEEQFALENADLALADTMTNVKDFGNE